MKLQAVINRLTGTTPVINTTTRKWPKYVKPKTSFESADGKYAVKLDKNSQFVDMVENQTLETEKGPVQIQVPMYPQFKGRPCRVNNGALEVAMTVTTYDKDAKTYQSEFDYYHTLIDEIKVDKK